MLDIFEKLADDARSITSGAERQVLRDFISFTDRHFANLGPFSTLDRCQEEESRVNRRLQILLGEAVAGEPVGDDGVILPGRHGAIRSAHLSYRKKEGPDVRLAMYPADTLTQAKAFYSNKEAVARVLALRTAGWTVKPNFHFGFMASGLCWTEASAPADAYAKYWLERISTTQELKKAKWPSFWKDLLALGFATAKNQTEFDEAFTKTNRSKASPRPGLACTYAWPLAKAEQLDGKGKLAGELKLRIAEFMKALGEPIA